jgi:osmotically-inducible protein OsmY
MFTSRRLTVVALAAALSGAACTDFLGDNCASPQCSQDASIRSEVVKQINARSSLRFFNLDVQTHNHAVYLEGLVDTGVDRDLAEQVALAVPGVSRVYNGLVIEGNSH